MKIREFIKKNYLLLALVLVTLFLGVATGGKLFYPGNIINLFSQNMYVFILASGMFICILTGGNIDLSCGSSVCLLAAIAFKLMENGLSGIPAFLLMLLLGILIGSLQGLLIGKYKLPSIIVTLANMSILRGLANVVLKGFTLSVSDKSFMNLFSMSRGFPYPVIFVLLCVLSAVYISEFAPLGKHIYALGGNKKSARLSGISESRIILFAYIFMGFCTAIASAVVAGRMETVGPSLAETYAMDAIAACFIGGVKVSGGKGRMSGVIIGALLMGIINQGMSILGLSAYYQNVIKGIVLVLAVLSGYFLNREGRKQA